MTGSPSRPILKLTTEAPDPRADPNLIRTFAGYRVALQSMTVEQLMAQANDLAARLEAQSRSTLTALISSPLSDSLQSLDRLQVRSLPTAHRPSDRDRGAQASQPSSLPRQPSALDLLAKSKHLGPRLAGKLVVAEARKRQAER